MNRLLVSIAIFANALISIDTLPSYAQRTARSSAETDLFGQIDDWLPTSNAYRTASGKPGPAYWQQRADYEIDVRLDDKNQTISGSEQITYQNFSPEPLSYLWLQLDQNIFESDADNVTAATSPSLTTRVPFATIRSLLARESFDGGLKSKT